MSVFGFNGGDMARVFRLLMMNLKRRYLGSKLGLVWAILNPLLMMSVYLFVFGFVLQSKAPGSERSLDYVVWFLCGFAPWMAVNEGVNTSALSVVTGVQLVKNFAIKSEVLPVSAAMMGLPQMIIGTLLSIALCLISGAGITWHIVFLIVIIPLIFAFLSGLAFFLSSATVFLRDFAQVIPTIMMLLMFFTPIFYTMDQMPYIVQRITFFNPVYQMCQPFRAVIYLHQLPDFLGLAYLAALALLLWWLGLKFFRKLKGYFESAL